MKHDLLMTDSDRLKTFLRTKRFWRTHEIIAWGSMNFSNRANRNKQELVAEGFLRRLSDEERCRQFGVHVKEGVYECVEFNGE